LKAESDEGSVQALQFFEAAAILPSKLSGDLHIFFRPPDAGLVNSQCS